MELERLQIFFDVFRAGSFAAAARRNNVDPSIISRTIASLEAELNMRLFNRTTRQMTPTEEGAHLFQRLSGPLDEIDSVLAEAKDIREQPSGLLRISASASFGAEHVVPRLPDFIARYPDLKVDLQLTDRRVDLVEEQVDIAIRHGILEDSELISKKLRDVNYHIVASEEYLKKNGRLEHPSELSKHRIATFTYPTFRHAWSFKNRNAPRSGSISCSFVPTLTVSSATALRACARRGMGIAILPDWMDMQGLETVLTDWTLVTGSGGALWQITASRRYMPGRVRAWLDFLQSEIGGRT